MHLDQDWPSLLKKAFPSSYKNPFSVFKRIRQSRGKERVEGETNRWLSKNSCTSGKQPQLPYQSGFIRSSLAASLRRSWFAFLRKATQANSWLRFVNCHSWQKSHDSLFVTPSWATALRGAIRFYFRCRQSWQRVFVTQCLATWIIDWAVSGSNPRGSGVMSKQSQSRDRCYELFLWRLCGCHLRLDRCFPIESGSKFSTNLASRSEEFRSALKQTRPSYL